MQYYVVPILHVPHDAGQAEIRSSISALLLLFLYAASVHQPIDANIAHLYCDLYFEASLTHPATSNVGDIVLTCEAVPSVHVPSLPGNSKLLWLHKPRKARSVQL